MDTSVLSRLQKKAGEIWQSENILNEQITVSARTLSVEEAIGNPEGDDFPLQRGKERLMEATFHQSRGQAFTDQYGDFSATLQDLVTMKLDNNFRRAIFIAAFNAVQRHLGQAEGTIHCRDKGPGICAPKLAAHILEKYGQVRITQIGYQPKMIESLADMFEMRVVDLDPDNIGTKKSGIIIEGPSDTEDAIQSAELLLVTGSTIVNDTLGDFLVDNKPTLFFGTTVAAAAPVMELDRFCCESM